MRLKVVEDSGLSPRPVTNSLEVIAVRLFRAQRSFNDQRKALKITGSWMKPDQDDFLIFSDLTFVRGDEEVRAWV
jgi:hypothetical protein